MYRYVFYSQVRHRSITLKDIKLIFFERFNMRYTKITWEWLVTLIMDASASAKSASQIGKEFNPHNLLMDMSKKFSTDAISTVYSSFKDTPENAIYQGHH